MWDSSDLRVGVLEAFAAFTPGMDLSKRDMPWHTGTLQVSKGTYQPCGFIPPPRPSHRATSGLSNAELCKRWKAANADYVKADTKARYAVLKADRAAYEAKLAYQRYRNCATGRPAKEWAELKADPARHAEELEKQRARYRARKARQSSSVST